MDDAAAAAAALATLPSLPPVHQPSSSSPSDNIQQDQDGHDNNLRNVSFESTSTDVSNAPAPAPAAANNFVVPNFNATVTDFHNQSAELSDEGRLSKLAGFDPTKVKITPSNATFTDHNRYYFASYNFTFTLNDGTHKHFKNNGQNGVLQNVLEFAFRHECATPGELNLGVLVSKDAIDLANSMQYPLDQCAMLLDVEGNPRLLHLGTGQMARSHVEFCSLTGIDYNTLLSYDVVNGKVNAAILGLPFYGENACSVRRAGKIYVTPIGENARSLFKVEMSNLQKAYKALNIEQPDILRDALAVAEALLGEEWETIPVCDRTINNFKNGTRLKYSQIALSDGATRLGPYNYTILFKHLYRLLQRKHYDESARLAGNLLCLTHRIVPGNYLPNYSDCTLSSTAVEEIEVEGGRMENSLVYRHQLTYGEYVDEEGDHGFSAVEPGTILVVNAKSLRDEFGKSIDNYSIVDGMILVRYDGLHFAEGRVSVRLRVDKDGDDDEVYQLPCGAEEDLSNVMGKNLFVVHWPGALPTFYEDDPCLDGLIRLRETFSVGLEETKDTAVGRKKRSKNKTKSKKKDSTKSASTKKRAATTTKATEKPVYKANPAATAALKAALNSAQEGNGVVDPACLMTALGFGYSKAFIDAKVDEQEALNVKPAAKKMKTN